ncbi:hypothetical protein [Nocardia neocaledoniensis]|nr:hypothetical protein [Nocardia neocaledoniensis]
MRQHRMGVGELVAVDTGWMPAELPTFAGQQTGNNSPSRPALLG